MNGSQYSFFYNIKQKKKCINFNKYRKNSKHTQKKSLKFPERSEISPKQSQNRNMNLAPSHRGQGIDESFSVFAQKDHHTRHVSDHEFRVRMI